MNIASEIHAAAQRYDELLDAEGKPRQIAQALWDYLQTLPPTELAARVAAVDAAIMTAGITFTVYTDAGNIDPCLSGCHTQPLPVVC